MVLSQSTGPILSQYPQHQGVSLLYWQQRDTKGTFLCEYLILIRNGFMTGDLLNLLSDAFVLIRVYCDSWFYFLVQMPLLNSVWTLTPALLNSLCPMSSNLYTQATMDMFTPTVRIHFKYTYGLMGGLKKGCLVSDIGDGKSNLKDHIFYKLLLHLLRIEWLQMNKWLLPHGFSITTHEEHTVAMEIVICSFQLVYMCVGACERTCAHVVRNWFWSRRIVTVTNWGANRLISILWNKHRKSKRHSKNR